MKIGTYYYPEQWPAEQWERDFDNIAGMGLQIVHMAEFAWFSLEPHAGEFRFDWLDRCLEMAKRRKLDVILCTPTASPPIWLVDQFPSILPQDRHGTRARFGGRRHYNPCSLAMQEATQRIVTKMAEHFGNHPAVIGWQLDNEYSSGDQGLSVTFDQSEETHKAWQRWLQKKYGSLEALHRAWGCQFWNTYYTDFAQILLPPERDSRYGNPHQCLDASRFWSSAFAQFNKLQADILRPCIGERFITTNFMPFHLDVDPADMSPDLNLMSWDSYPLTGSGAEAENQNFRIGNPNQIGFTHDHMASYHNRWALMELQPGHVNWSGCPVLPYPGAIRLWLWTAFAHGAEFVTTYRFRQPLFGIEMFHHGLMQTDGTTPSVGGREFMEVIDEISRLDLGKISGGSAQPVAAIVFDYDNLWYFKTLPQSRKWDQPAWLMMWYGALARLGFNIKILRQGQPIPPECVVVVAPGLQIIDDTTPAQFQQFVARGGHLVLTCRTGTMNRNGQFFEGHVAKPLLSLIGASIEAYDALPDGLVGHVDLEGKKFGFSAWGDLLYPEQDTKVVAKYADQFYEDAAAVTFRRHGTGSVTYCGPFGESDFVDAVLERLVARVKLPVSFLPTRVQVLHRGAYRILLNYQDKAVDAPAPAKARFIVGARHVDPAGVAVWIE